MDGRLWRGYLLFGLGAVAAYPLLPGGVWKSDVFFDMFGLVAVAAVVWGVWRNRPRHRWPWLLLAAGQGLFVAGDVAFSVYDHVLHQTPFPSAADGLYLAGYPMLAGGLLLLIRRRRPGQDWASLLDASIVAVGLGSVSWALLMAPYLRDHSLSLPGLLISLAYPLADVLLLAVTARLVFGGGRRSVSLCLLGFSLAVLLVTDSIYGWLNLRGAYVSGDAVDIGWIASYALFGAAALHPSMVHASDRVRSTDVRFSPWRLALLGLALAAVPVGLAVESLRGDAVNVTMFAVAGMLLIALTLARLGGVIRANERSIRREALLRQAGSALVRASDAEAIYVVGVGTARALAQEARTFSLLALGSPDRLTVVAAADAESARLTDHALPVLPQETQLALAGGETVDVPGFALAAKGSPAMMARLCPLFVGDHFRGVLAVQSAEGRLSSQGGDALELLAGQVSIALETQELTEEVFRRRSEERFRSLVQSSPDIVIRFDSDLRHLYINDAVAAVTGLPPERFAGRTNRDMGMAEELCTLFERELGAVFEHGEARRFEFQFDGVDGVRWMEAHVVPECNAAGEVETIVSFTRDRTEARRAEQEKSASEARYRELFERAMDMIVVLDREGRLVEVNPAVARTLGYQREELIGRPFASILAPEEADAGVARFARKLDGSEPASLYQSVLLSKDGRRVPFEANSEVILRDGALHGVLVIARDVSERVAARAALEESERRFRTAFEGAAVGMVLSDPAGTLLRVNAAFAEMLGYRPSELVEVRVGDIVHPDDRAALADDIETLRAGLEARCVAERRYLRKDGEIVLGHVNISTVRADDGSALYFVAQIEDVTELRRVQAELDESQALHRVVIESSYDALAVLDLDGTIRLASRSIENTLGYTQQDLVGRGFLELLHPDDQQAAQAAAEAALRGAEPLVSRSRTLAKDGSIRLWDGTIAPGRGKDGEPSFLVANAHDVTSQVQLEDQLRQAQKMEAVGRLAGGVAHDFNNLLTAIYGYAELALQKVETRDDSSAEIGEVVAAAEKAASLTTQLLAFSRRQVMKTETFDLCDVVANMVKLLRRLIGEDIELTTVWPDEPTLIHADPAQIEQVIVNLAVNARDAMPDGGCLSIEVAQAADERQALLIVRDNGTGMDATTAAQIFEPFFTTKGVGEGTGLGLSMVHGIISQSDGQIAVESEPGQGTTFTITLPLADSVGALPESVATAPASGGAETILLVEDDPSVRAVVTSMLDQRGYRPVPAGSGEEALALAHATPGTVDLLITDLVMGGLNGRETAEAVREHQPQAKVLYMSGYTDDAAIRVHGHESGISFLQKPFSGEELGRRVRELLDSNAA